MSGNYTSGIMTVTPDPIQTHTMLAKNVKLRKELQTLQSNLGSPE
jgi:hypothetical protein